ncbi:MAG: hypothetical protein WBN92_13160 [Terriglobia bacterium]
MFNRVFILIALIAGLCACLAGPMRGQETQTTGSSALPQNNLTGNTPVLVEEALPPGARLYISPIQNGFETYIIAGLQKKNVPLVIVIDRTKADYELTGVSETDKAGWAKMLFMNSQQSNESASIKIVNLKTGAVAFAYSVNKTNSVRGKQSAGEAVAKHIKEKIENRYH